MTIKRIIAKLEKQHRELGEILLALRGTDAATPIKADGTFSLDYFEKRVIAGALEHAVGNQTEATHLLGIGRDKLRYKMRKHRITSWG